MSRSKAAMNSAALSTLRAAVMEAKRSTTSAWVSAWRERVKRRIKTRTRLEPCPTLRPVAAIDFDVLLGQVAGPEAGAGFAVAVDDELDGAVDAVEFLFQMLLFKIGGDTALT